ncbi:MAG: hypothetical protein NC099_02645 [Corallococcus sp.]|nr:hypothetical protein [Bacillota bacterium]MCM1533531.1 hypothetical protein [Corallococcus sp.]
MEIFLEFLFELIFEPILIVLFYGPIEILSTPIELAAKTSQKRGLPKWLRIVLATLMIVAVIASIAAIAVGAVLISKFVSDVERTRGIVLLVVGIVLFVAYCISSIALYCNKDVRRARKIAAAKKKFRSCSKFAQILGRGVTVDIDRPVGCAHPVYEHIALEVNCGSVRGQICLDGSCQCAFVLGVEEPLDVFEGTVSAVICRGEDDENIWIVTPENYAVTQEEVLSKTHFEDENYAVELLR